MPDEPWSTPPVASGWPDLFRCATGLACTGERDRQVTAVFGGAHPRR